MRRRLTRSAGKHSVFGRTTLAALCVLGLAACGSEQAGDRAAGDRAAAAQAHSRVATSPPATAPDSNLASDSNPAPDSASASASEETEGLAPLAYMELLLDIAEPCLPSDLPTSLPSEELAELEKVEERELGGTVPPEEPAPVPLPDEPVPSSEPRDPEKAAQETELSSVEKCEAPLHAERVTAALEKTPDPTPAQVAETLRGLGYIDDAVHGPQRADDADTDTGAGAVEFILDLRMFDSGLCLSGSTTGTRTTIEAYGGSPEVECADVRRTS
ncbi:hypothetical protein [Streptomyces sp. S.PB5]|uniref:hypothetical protein n=1 Tax=Streptomyces sp. S.PB5 TaxID=3020844 RepID=UPI0025B0F7FC|nr:hypothetical protein [Streptomyces sp. S.PB5]MDN3022577.1 hypothetical protein [Streptomyces sp. S.PB5]